MTGNQKGLLFLAAMAGGAYFLFFRKAQPAGAAVASPTSGTGAAPPIQTPSNNLWQNPFVRAPDAANAPSNVQELVEEEHGPALPPLVAPPQGDQTWATAWTNDTFSPYQ